MLFPREEFSPGRSQFCIINTDRGKVKGGMPFCPMPGQVLNLTGEWEIYHGNREFKFWRVSQDVPRDPKVLLEYVCKVGKGLGPKTAEKLWQDYGAEWQRHLDEMPQSTSIILTRTLNALDANQAKLDLVLYCIKIGGSPAIADKAWHAWKENAIATINANPYALAALPGIGFKTADSLRGKFGIGDLDPRRALAAIDFAVTDLMESSGNSIVARDSLYSAIKDFGIPRAVAMVNVAKLVQDGRLVFVGLEHITTSAVVRCESDLARYIVEERTSGASASVSWDYGFKPDDAQERAAAAAVANRGLVVINGGAGTGKTTIVSSIARTLEENGNTVDLCAFAGKAAARLREATGHSASTIHSLLGYTGEGAGFSVGSLEGHSVIVDESSMVPSGLLYEITKRNPSRLVLVGDQAQLQPVGIGSPFHDVIDSLPSVVNTLDRCHRNRAAVFAAATAIRNGEMPKAATAGGETFDFVRVRTPEEAHQFIVDRIEDGSIDFSQDLILAPRNGEGEDPAPCTVKSLNESAQNIVNRHHNDERFKVGDRVMCVKNFPKLNIWNGTVGFISRIDADGIPFLAPDDGSEVRLGERDHRDNIVPAYCLTVHKSQGSQYRKVYIVVLKRDGAVLMDRSMLYTAVTRARCECHIVTDEGLDRVIGKVRRRSTYLKMLLEGRM